MIEKELTVAVVDDDPSVRRGLERLLRSAGYQVATFGSARAFLERGGDDPLGCLVLDVRMPGQSGLDLHEVLLASDDDVPVVFISGHGDIRMDVRTLKAGAVDFLTKPFEGPTLLGAVQQAMARAHRRRHADAQDRAAGRPE